MRIYLIIGGLVVVLAAGIVGAWLLWPKGPPAGPESTTTLLAQAQPAPAAPAANPDNQASTDDGSLRVCNRTANPVSIALGYRADRGWQSEGWWVAQPSECQTVYSGKLDARYYYIYAADDIGGGSWDGNNYMCTRDETFTIFGVEDCLARGYERTGFFEIDTQNRSNWTLQLTDGEVLGTEPATGTDDVPLEGGGAGDDQPEQDNLEGEVTE